MKNKFLMGIFLTGSLATDIFAHGGGAEDGDGMMGYNMMGGFGMGFSWLILILLGVFLYFMFNKKNNQNENSGGTTSARDILDKRFANGEIDKEEYEAKKEILEKG